MPRSVETSIPRDFSAFERSLAAKTEVAIADGLQLERWTRDPGRKIEKHRLNLNRHYDLRNEAYGYLAEVTIGGRTLKALGALQQVEFGSIPGPTTLTGYIRVAGKPSAHNSRVAATCA